VPSESIDVDCRTSVDVGTLMRTIASLSDTLKQRGDPFLSFPSSVTVSLPKPFPQSLVPNREIPQYSAIRCDKPPTIDGKLDEEAWKSTTKMRSFVDLISGKKTLHETRAAVLWDDDYMYVGFWITEPNVDAKYTKRDDPIYQGDCTKSHGAHRTLLR